VRHVPAAAAKIVNKAATRKISFFSIAAAHNVHPNNHVEKAIDSTRGCSISR
jgi:hypothetical protein